MSRLFGQALLDSVGFVAHHTFPHDWTLDNPKQRRGLASELGLMGQRIMGGEKLVDVYEDALGRDQNLAAA